MVRAVTVQFALPTTDPIKMLERLLNRGDATMARRTAQLKWGRVGAVGHLHSVEWESRCRAKPTSFQLSPGGHVVTRGWGEEGERRGEGGGLGGGSRADPEGEAHRGGGIRGMSRGRTMRPQFRVMPQKIALALAACTYFHIRDRRLPAAGRGGQQSGCVFCGRRKRRQRRSFGSREPEKTKRCARNTPRPKVSHSCCPLVRRRL